MPTRSLWMAGALLLLAGCQRDTPPAPPTAVQVKVLRPETVQLATRFSARVEARQAIDLSFNVPGTVDLLHRVQVTPPPASGPATRDAQEGDVVARGTILAQLETRDYLRARDLARAKLDTANANVERARANADLQQRNAVSTAGLLERNAATDKELKDAQSRAQIAQAEYDAAIKEKSAAEVALNQAQDRLDDCALRVPGEPDNLYPEMTVALKAVEPRERVAAGQRVFRVIDISTVHVVFGVPDTMISPGRPGAGGEEDRVYVGQRLEVSAEAFEGAEPFAGRVTKIAAEADPKTRTFLTEVSIENPRDGEGKFKLKPGMIVTIKVGAEKPYVLVPLTAVQRGERPDDMVVYRVSTGQDGQHRAEPRHVRLGGVVNNLVELREGSEVAVGDAIVVTGASRLTPAAGGLPVRVLETPAATQAGGAP